MTRSQQAAQAAARPVRSASAIQVQVSGIRVLRRSPWYLKPLT